LSVSLPAGVREATAYLETEVPRWKQENGCYSCHNNGDAVRVLCAALKAGELADRHVIADSLDFLLDPASWDANGPEGPFKDKKLARIQFAAALAAARHAGLTADRNPLSQAAALVAELQLADGSWETDAPGSVGSPATYGRTLATAISLRTLVAADPTTYRARIAKAQNWLETTPPKGVLDAAATLWGLTATQSEAAAKARERALAIVRKGASPDGGWGPFVNSPPEVFDTALVVLALAEQGKANDLAPLIACGRKFLLAEQSPDGSWPSTTRPSGGHSYAQQISTTAWAAQALLATRPR
jgi:hypothetical protein